MRPTIEIDPSANNLIPVPLVTATTGEQGQTILLLPHFASPDMTWLRRVLPKPYQKVRLDEVGSFVWRRIDGIRTAGEIVEAFRGEFRLTDQSAPCGSRWPALRPART